MYFLSGVWYWKIYKEKKKLYLFHCLMFLYFFYFFKIIPRETLSINDLLYSPWLVSDLSWPWIYFFFTHILQLNTIKKKTHIQIHLAWVGIVEKISGNQERKKKHLKEGQFLCFKPLPEGTNAKKSINLFRIILIFYLNYNGSQQKKNATYLFF